MKRLALICVASFVLNGCTSRDLNHALGTPKNPAAVFSSPVSRYVGDEDLLIQAYYNTLVQHSIVASENGPILNFDASDMKNYVAAGFGLSDIYCRRFFTQAGESSQRRRYARSLVNDVGTAVTTVLGLANAGKDSVTALAALTGFGDSALRNYDETFMVQPDLGPVLGLVWAAQDNYRQKVLGKDGSVPTDIASANHVIERYAAQCSTLGIRNLISQSATEGLRKLNDDTDDKRTGGSANGGNAATPPPPKTEQAAPPVSPAGALPTPPG